MRDPRKPCQIRRPSANKHKSLPTSSGEESSRSYPKDNTLRAAAVAAIAGVIAGLLGLSGSLIVASEQANSNQQLATDSYLHDQRLQAYSDFLNAANNFFQEEGNSLINSSIKGVQPTALPESDLIRVHATLSRVEVIGSQDAAQQARAFDDNAQVITLGPEFAGDATANESAPKKAPWYDSKLLLLRNARDGFQKAARVDLVPNSYN